MNDDFDPYLHWLGIGPDERPVDHYRLLGVGRFETDPQMIGAAADERMSFVRSFQTGPRGSYTQRLLNDLATARVCLLNPRTKATYDDFLRGLAAATPHGASFAFPTPIGGDTVAMPPTSGAPLASSSGAPPTPVPPMATPVAHLMPGGWAGHVPMAVPVARPMAAPIGGYSSTAAPPVSYAPASEPPQVAPPAEPPRPDMARLPAPRTPRDATPTLPAESANSSPADGEPLESIVTRRWFPVAVIGAVLVVAGAVWGVGNYLNRPAPSDGTAEDEGDDAMAAQSEAPLDEPKTSKKRSDEYPSEVVLAQEGTGQINFPASVAKLLGPTLTLHIEGPEPVITGWTSDDDAVSWDFRVVRPDIFRVEITYAAEAEWAGGQFTITVGDAEKTGEVVSSGGAGTFRTDKVFLPVRRQGKQTLIVRTIQRPGTQLWVLKSIRFEPQGVSGK